MSALSDKADVFGRYFLRPLLTHLQLLLRWRARRLCATIALAETDPECPKLGGEADTLAKVGASCWCQFSLFEYIEPKQATGTCRVEKLVVVQSLL